MEEKLTSVCCPFFFTYMTPTVLFYIQVIIQESTILQKSIR